MNQLSFSIIHCPPLVGVDYHKQNLFPWIQVMTHLCHTSSSTVWQSLCFKVDHYSLRSICMFKFIFNSENDNNGTHKQCEYNRKLKWALVNLLLNSLINLLLNLNDYHVPVMLLWYSTWIFNKAAHNKVQWKISQLGCVAVFLWHHFIKAKFG